MVDAVLDRVKPSDQYWKRSEDVLGKIEKYVSEIFPDYKVGIRPFGSYVQHTAMKGSDVDLAIVFDGVVEFDNDPNDQSIASKNLKIRLLNTLSERLKTKSATLNVLEEVFTAKVPVLKIEYKDEVDDEPLDVDISVGKWTTGAADYMIGELLETNDIVRDTYYLLKAWVKARLSCPDKTPAFHGLLNSFSWVLLFIYHCQQQGYLTPYNARDRETVVLDKTDMCAILESFFGFMLSLDKDRCRQEKKLSIFHGTALARMGGDFRAQSLWVEDPSLQSNNTARCCRPSGWNVIISECYRAKMVLAEGGDFDFLYQNKMVDVRLLGGNVQPDDVGKRQRESLEMQQSWKRRRTDGE